MNNILPDFWKILNVNNGTWDAILFLHKFEIVNDYKGKSKKDTEFSE